MTNYSTRKYGGSTKIFSNLDQEVIEITSDRLKIILSEYFSQVRNSQEWGTYLGIMLTVLATLLTATFKNFASIDASSWQAMFLLVLLVSAYKFVRSLIVYFRLRALDAVIAEIKNESGT